jgi:hypothetical protein
VTNLGFIHVVVVIAQLRWFWQRSKGLDILSKAKAEVTLDTKSDAI